MRYLNFVDTIAVRMLGHAVSNGVSRPGGQTDELCIRGRLLAEMLRVPRRPWISMRSRPNEWARDSPIVRRTRRLSVRQPSARIA